MNHFSILREKEYSPEDRFHKDGYGVGCVVTYAGDGWATKTRHMRDDGTTTWCNNILSKVQ
jgi:hypothetical protein